MCSIIYVDFDGVLVDTPKFINREITKYGNSDDVFKHFQWKYFLQNCNEICNNLFYIKEIAKKYKVVILTHVYSINEKIEKEKYIFSRLQNIEVISVPYFVEKNNMVNPKGNILIDDYKKNINKWIESGGIGIYLNNEKRIDKLLANYGVLICEEERA